MQLLPQVRRHKHQYLAIAPAMLTILLVVGYPLLYNMVISFFGRGEDWSSFVFVGAINYLKLFKSSSFWRVVAQTVAWAIGSVSLQFALGLIGALLMNRPFRGRGIVGGLMLLPWTSSFAVAALVWKWLFHPQLGAINDILLRLGLISQEINWFANPSTAMAAVIIANVWKYFPFMMTMLLAGLQGIPQQLYEAAAIDGATAWDAFRHVTMPQLSPVIAVSLLLAATWAINAFSIVYLMTGGGPAHTTEILPVYIYRLAFNAFDFGPAAAASMLLFVAVLVISVFYLRMLNREGD